MPVVSFASMFVFVLVGTVALAGAMIVPRPKPPELVTMLEKNDARESSPSAFAVFEATQKQLPGESANPPYTDHIPPSAEERRLLGLEVQLKDALRQTRELRVDMQVQRARQAHERNRDSRGAGR